ncbi:MAG: S4 domain-containing protein [Blastomonas sp.]
MADPGAGASLRIDVLLWRLRFAKSRSIGKAMAEKGHIRVNGQRIVKAHHAVRCGDVVTLMLGGVARSIRLDALPVRRGPAAEAMACYALL